MKLFRFMTNGRSNFVFDIDVEKTCFAGKTPDGISDREWVEINPCGLWAPGWEEMRNLGERLDRNGSGPYILVSNTVKDRSPELRAILAKIPDSPGLWLCRICEEDREWLRQNRAIASTKEGA